MFTFIYLSSIYLSIHLSIYLSIFYLSIYLFIYLFICQFSLFSCATGVIRGSSGEKTFSKTILLITELCCMVHIVHVHDYCSYSTVCSLHVSFVRNMSEDAKPKVCMCPWSKNCVLPLLCLLDVHVLQLVISVSETRIIN